MLGSVTDVTSSGGDHEWAYTYEPFGTIRESVKVDATATQNDMLFTGELRDPTGLYHLRARQYDPGVGRFTAIDPAPAGPSDPHASTYAYVNNRPTLFVDPSGLFCVLGHNPNGSCRGSGVARGIASRTGDEVNDAIGAAVGGIANLTGGTPRKCGNATCVQGNSLVTGVLDLVGDADAITFGHTIVGNDELSDSCLVQHELTHVRQYEESGGFFLPIYGWDAIWNGGSRDNVYEMEAYAVQDSCVLSQNRK